MRLIDADTLQFVPKGTKYVVGKKGFINRMAAVQEAIDKTPTIDAVPVVRCKDCKRLVILSKYGVPLCDEGTGFKPLCYDINTWFCPLGERRDENEAD